MNNNNNNPGEKQAEIYTYEAPWLIYACNWSVRSDKKLRLGIGSFLEEYQNKVEIVALDEETGQFINDPQLRFDHPYPCTKLMFVPDKDCQHEDLMATTGDFLRIWKINEEAGGGGTAKEKAKEKEEEQENDTNANNNANNNNNRKNLKKGGRDTNTEKPSTSGQEKQQQQQQNGSNNINNTSINGQRGEHQQDGKIELRALLANNKNSEYCAPLTSFDWNETNVNRVGTSSIDTTCTVWDIERECVDTQLIAHDKEVHDIAWGGPDVFASASADGSVRVFDLRDKDHSTIIYENPEIGVPLLRLGWNKQDPRYMATFGMDSKTVAIIDIRFPTLPVAELKRHASSVNTLAWAPHSSCHICSAGDDAQALIWDLSAINQLSEGGLDPVLAYEAGSEINQLQWSATQPDWIAIAFSQSLQILRV